VPTLFLVEKDNRSWSESFFSSGGYRGRRVSSSQRCRVISLEGRIQPAIEKDEKAKTFLPEESTLARPAICG
jgi:hypothetical protein